jgi:hypothetical protein
LSEGSNANLNGHTISGWGRVPVPGREVRSEDLEALTRDAVLCRGLGRSYGDSSLPPPSHPVVATTTLADRVLAFDPETGVVRAEAGLAADQPPVPAPGFYAPSRPARSSSRGGMVAADVHGKNHHRDGCSAALSCGRVADGRPWRRSEQKPTSSGPRWRGRGSLPRWRRWSAPFRLDRGESERSTTSTLHRRPRRGDWPTPWAGSTARADGLGRGILMRSLGNRRKRCPVSPAARRPAVLTCRAGVNR